MGLGGRLVLSLLLTAPLFAGFEQIRELIRRGNFTAALQACDQDLKIDPREHRIWTLKGIALQGLGRGRQGLEAFRRALTLQPEFIPALQGAAQLEYELRDPECRNTLERILKLRAATPAAYAMLGALDFERKDCAGAIRHYAQAGEAVSNPIVRRQLGSCYYRQREWDAAEAQFRELLRLKEDDQVRYNLGLVQLEANRPADAIATLLPLGRKEVPDSDAMSLLAGAYEADKQTPEALETLRRTIELYPREERLYADLANICLEHQAIQLGAEILETGAKNIPRSARIQTMLGVLYSRAALRDKAEEAFRKAEQLAPDAGFGRVGLAVAMMQLNALEEAVQLLSEQARRAPDDPRVNVTLAQALLQKNPSAEELQEAESRLRGVVEREPSNAKAHSLLGKLYFQREDTANAVRALETAVRLDPADRTAAYQLMILYRRLGRTEEAGRLQEKVRALLDAERAQEAETGRYRLVRAPDERPAQ